MTGQHIAALLAAVGPMKRPDVVRSRDAWKEGAESLDNVVRALDAAAPLVREGFGETSAVANAAQEALFAMSGKVVTRRDQMKGAEDALEAVRAVMLQAEVESRTMPTEAPGEPPKMEGGPYTDDRAEITALKIYASKNKVYTDRVNAYGDADERAREQVRTLNQTYDEASAVLAEIHGDPSEPVMPTGGPTGSGGSRSTAPVKTVRPTGVIDNSDTVDTGTGDTDDTGTDDTGTGDTGTDDTGTGDTGTGTGDTGTDDTDSNDDAPDIDHPGDDTTPGDDEPGTGTGGLHGSSATALPGAVAGGILGGAGLRGLITGGTATPSVPGQQAARPIGASARSGAGGVLGRGGAAVPGQPVGRGGAGGRHAGGRGVPGTAAGRGQRKKDERDAEQEAYEAERDWTDDEGQYPGVIS